MDDETSSQRLIAAKSCAGRVVAAKSSPQRFVAAKSNAWRLVVVKSWFVAAKRSLVPSTSGGEEWRSYPYCP